MIIKTTIVNNRKKKPHFKLWDKSKKIWIRWSQSNLISTIWLKLYKLSYHPCQLKYRLSKSYLLHLLQNLKMYRKLQWVNSHLLKKQIKINRWKYPLRKNPSWKKGKSPQEYFSIKTKNNKQRKLKAHKITSRS